MALLPSDLKIELFYIKRWNVSLLHMKKMAVFWETSKISKTRKTNLLISNTDRKML